MKRLIVIWLLFFSFQTVAKMACKIEMNEPVGGGKTESFCSFVIINGDNCDDSWESAYPTYANLLEIAKSSPENRNRIASLMRSNGDDVERKLMQEYFEKMDPKEECNGPNRTFVDLFKVKNYRSDCNSIRSLVTSYNRHLNPPPPPRRGSKGGGSGSNIEQ